MGSESTGDMGETVAFLQDLMLSLARGVFVNQSGHGDKAVWMLQWELARAGHPYHHKTQLLSFSRGVRAASSPHHWHSLVPVPDGAVEHPWVTGTLLG